MAAVDWDINPGDVVRRAEVHLRFGGQMQGGISTSRTSPNVMIFADPVRSKDHGYDVFEGQQSDGSFHYTGQGQLGNMTLTGPNKRVLDAASNRDAIRLFLGDPPWATYVGAYALGEPPFRWEQMPDRRGNMRKGLVFHLVPVEAEADLVPVAPGIEDLWTGDWKPRDSTPYAVAPSVAAQIAKREEFSLEARFGEWLRSRGHTVQTLRVRTGGRSLNPDIFDATDQVIVEAKKSARSEDVRMAVGQVLDYVHCAGKKGISAVPAILVPSRPNVELVALCRSLHITVWIPSGKTSFTDVTN